MDRELMEFLTNPEFVKVVLAIVALISTIIGIPVVVIGAWAYQAKKAADVAKINAQAAKEKTEADAMQDRASASAIVAVAKSIQQMSETMVKNAENGLSERREMMAQMARDQAAWRDEFSRQYTQLGIFAGTMASNTEAMNAMTAENIEGRKQAVAAVAATVNEGVETIRKEFIALRGEWLELTQNIAKQGSACQEELAPILGSIDKRLSAIQQQVIHVTPEPPKPDIAPPAADEPKQDIA